MNRRDLLILSAGTAIARPLIARAQQRAMPVIGWLSSGSAELDAFRVAAFRQGLPALAADLVARQVTVILAVAAPAAVAAKAATTTIPIVFNLGDPIQFGLVASLNNPGGNLTGVAHMTGELAGKRLQLLRDLVSGVTVVAALVNPANPIASEEEAKSLREATRRLGMQLHVLPASNPSEIDAAFLSLVEFRAGALVVSADTLFTNRKEQIIALAARHEVPAIYVYPGFAAAGGLMSYGDDLVESYRQAGTLAGKILQGARPADLPVQQAVKLELIINLKTAKALGLTVPQALLARADEVIE